MLVPVPVTVSYRTNKKRISGPIGNKHCGLKDFSDGLAFSPPFINLPPPRKLTLKVEKLGDLERNLDSFNNFFQYLLAKLLRFLHI